MLSARDRQRARRGSKEQKAQKNTLEEPATSKFTEAWERLRERLPSIAEDAPPPQGSKLPSVMAASLLAPGSFEAPNKQRQIQDAKDMYQTVVRNAERSNSAAPPYTFIELIGKGGYGRVYKCLEQATGQLVAVKIINIDDADFQEHFLDKDNTIASFRKEVEILQQLKDNKAKNVNMIHTAFDLHNQLWIVSDYCTGGSLRTLMRANPPPRRGFEEHFLLPIARELATAIKSVHDIGVIHRDIKCANVYVNEEGDIQLGDFGIVGVVDDGSSKRRTIVGTPHYLPREMHLSSSHLTDEAYGTEVDIWSYGITMFEAATGLPPYANVPQSQFHTVVDNPPRLEGDDYSDELKAFIAYCLDSDPKSRPSAAEVLTHPYIADSSKRYPTRGLVRLIERYAGWEYKGGQRQSLWAPGGAMGPVVSSGDDSDNQIQSDSEDWNFSTSDNFNEAFGRRYSQMVSAQDFANPHFDAPAGSGLPPLITKDLTPFERFEQEFKEKSANRGERSLDRLFNPETAPYELHTPVEDTEPMSDLPFRNMASTAPARESVIDLDHATGLDVNVPTFNFDFGDVPTLKARTSRPTVGDDDEEQDHQHNLNERDERRATMDWTFPAAAEKKRATMDWSFQSAGTVEPEDPNTAMNLPSKASEGLSHGFRPTLKHTATEPVGNSKNFTYPPRPSAPTEPSPVRQSVASMIDLDMGLADPADIERPSTASSATGSTATDMTSGNPFDLEDNPEQNEVDRNRFSYHKQWQSEGGQPKRLSHKTMPMHSRGSSLSGATDLELDRTTGEPAPTSDVFDYEYGREGFQDEYRTHMFAGMPQYDIGHWPNFGSNSGLDESPKYPSTYTPRLADPDFPVQQGLRTNGLPNPSSMRLRNGNRVRRPQREIEFVDPVAPHPDALLEDANPELVMSELERLLEDFDQNLEATARALGQHTGVETESESSEAESGRESSGAVTTGDEDGF